MKTLNVAKNVADRSSSRDAVETAIGLSKEQKSETWEGWISRNPNRIAQWSENSTRPAEAEKGEHPAPKSTARRLGGPSGPPRSPHQ